MAGGNMDNVNENLRVFARVLDVFVRSGDAEMIDYALFQALDQIVGAFRLARKKGLDLPLMRRKGYN